MFEVILAHNGSKFATNGSSHEALSSGEVVGRPTAKVPHGVIDQYEAALNELYEDS